jgi:hypothetical protein
MAVVRLDGPLLHPLLAHFHARVCLWLGTFLVALSVSSLAVAGKERTTVAFDLTHLEDRSYEALDGLGLEKRLVLRLVQEGFAVVGLTTNPEIIIGITVEKGAVVLRADAANSHEHREIDWDKSVKRELMHLEVAQKTVELARAVEPTLPSTAPPENKPSPPQQQQTKVEPSARETHRVPEVKKELEPWLQRRYTVEIATGALYRPAALDPIERLAFSLWVFRRLRLGVEAGVIPASRTSIQVTEFFPSLTVGTGFEWASRWSLVAALRGGALVHHYRMDDPSAEPRRGWRVSGLFECPFRVKYDLFPWFGFIVEVAPGVSTFRRRHVLGGKTLWSRGYESVESTFGANFSF